MKLLSHVLRALGLSKVPAAAEPSPPRCRRVPVPEFRAQCTKLGEAIRGFEPVFAAKLRGLLEALVLEEAVLLGFGQWTALEMTAALEDPEAIAERSRLFAELLRNGEARREMPNRKENANS